MKCKVQQIKLFQYLATTQVLGNITLKALVRRVWEDGDDELFVRVTKKVGTSFDKVPYRNGEEVNLGDLTPYQRDSVYYVSRPSDHFCDYLYDPMTGRMLTWEYLWKGDDPVSDCKLPEKYNRVRLSHFLLMLIEGKAKPSRLEVVGKNVGLSFDGFRIVEGFGGGYALRDEAGKLHDIERVVSRVFSVNG